MYYKYTWIIQFYLESGTEQLILVHFAFDVFVLLPDINIRTEKSIISKKCSNRQLTWSIQTFSKVFSKLLKDSAIK